MRTRDQVLDLLEDVVAGLVAQGARTLGLLMIFALGSGGLVAALGISQTAAQQIRERLSAAALDQVIAHPVRVISAEDAAADPATAAAPVSLPADTLARAALIDGVRAAALAWSVPVTAAGVTRLDATVTADELDTPVRVVGATPDILQIFDARATPAGATGLLDGATPRVSILGVRAAAALGVAAPGPGAQIRVAGIALDVIGFIQDTGRAPALANTVLVPGDLARAIAPTGVEQSLYVRTEPGLAFGVSAVLAATVNPSAPGAVEVEPVPDLRQLRRGVSTDLDSSAALLSVLMLVLASITTANVLTMAVNDRRSEVALRRAVGTSSRTVGVTFLLEGGVIGLLGGLAGTAAGVLTIVVVSWRQEWQPILQVWILPTGVLCGLTVGVIAAGRAALAAARIQPAIAVRG